MSKQQTQKCRVLLLKYIIIIYAEKKIHAFMKLEESAQLSQKPDTGLRPEPL
jgi:hypothetical protein